MAFGIVNVERKEESSVLVDSSSTVSFKLGCDDKGVFIVTPDENTNSNKGVTNHE